jgi:4-amino-4-deoxy-L-arabinose transferase-like glycosyltransferase
LTAKNKIIHYGVLSILIYLVVFVKLDAFHMRWWDESMFSVNAYEMIEKGDYFSLYFDGHPDLFNTKPPLLIWFQVLFIKLLGYNELAIRLPSALATSLSIIIIFSFMQKREGFMMAWISALILLTAEGFVTFHTGRTGDSDALLTLFILIANLSFLRAVYEDKKIFLFYFFLFLTLAFATKMFAALLFVPAYLVILIRNKFFRQLFFNRFFWIGSAFFLGFNIALLLLRENNNPGYLNEILFKDVGRIFHVVESHEQSWHYYIDNLIWSRFSFWMMIFLIGSVMLFLKPRQTEKNVYVDFLFLVLSYLLIVSVSITKLEWYDMPLFPYLSCIAAFPIFKIFTSQIDSDAFGRKAIVVIAVIFMLPYWLAFRNSQANAIPYGERILEANERFIFLRYNSGEDLNKIKVFYNGWNGSLLFYKYKLKEAGTSIELSTIPEFNVNDRILVSNDSLYHQLESKYVLSVLDEENNARLLSIKRSLQ